MIWYRSNFNKEYYWKNVNSNTTQITTIIKAKLNKSDRQTEIDKNKVTIIYGSLKKSTTILHEYRKLQTDILTF